MAGQKYNEEAARAYLAEETAEVPTLEESISLSEPDERGYDDSAARDYLNSPDEPIAEVEPSLDPQQESGEKSFLESAGDWASGANDQIVSLLGLPADAGNWVLEKMDSDKRIAGGSKDISKGMAYIGAGYEQGAEPDTASYKSGEYVGIGLTFLMPFLRLGKGAAEMTAGVTTVTRNKAVVDESAGFFSRQTQKVFGKKVPTQVTAVHAVQESAGTLKGISQKISSPFVNAPKLALTAEVAASTGAGFGGEIGKEYGDAGEIAGNVIGGFAGTLAPHAVVIPHVQRYLKKAFFPFTKAGGDIKAANRLRTLAETVDVEKIIIENEKKMLPGSKLTPAKLSGDRHLEALEKEMLLGDPPLAQKFKMEEARVNMMARKEVEELGGNIRIEETQAYMKGRVDRIKKLINLRVRKAALAAQDEMVDLPAHARRKAANEIVNKQINGALDEARTVEKNAWQAIDQKVIAATDETKTVFRKHLDDQASTSDKKTIPEYLRTFLGNYDKKGKFVEGKLGSTDSVKELSALRSRINKDIRELKAADAPDYNKIRIMSDIQEAILKDLEKSPNSKNYTEAIAISRELNQKFSGGVLDSILGHEKTGGKLASELTLEGINNGPKAAVEIKRILAASPKSLGAVEEYVKIQIAQSNVVKDGRIALNAAKKYMAKNEEVMNIFPDLKNAMNNAISAQEKSEWLNKIGKKAIERVSKTLTAKLAGVKPKTFLKTVMESPNSVEAMRNLSKHLNEKGKAGIKHDIADYLLGKAKTAKFDDAQRPILSGRKFAYELEANEKIFREVMSEGELSRLKVVAETMIKNEGMDDLPSIGGVLAVEKNPLSIALEFVAARAGAKMGAKSHGAALKTSSMTVSLTKKILGDLDVGRATQLIKDALQDPILFKELISNHKTQADVKRFTRVFQGWMAASAIENISENN